MIYSSVICYMCLQSVDPFFHRSVDIFPISNFQFPIPNIKSGPGVLFFYIARLSESDKLLREPSGKDKDLRDIELTEEYLETGDFHCLSPISNFVFFISNTVRVPDCNPNDIVDARVSGDPRLYFIKYELKCKN